MTVKIGVEIEATTEGAVRDVGKFTKATDEARKATEKSDKALKAVSLAYQVQQARAKNLADRTKAFAKAEQAAVAATNRLTAANQKAASSFVTMAKNVASVAGKIRNVVSVAQTAASAISGVVETTVELAQESLQVTSVFDNLPFSLNAARTATRGLADDMTLATNAILANQSGIAPTAERYAELVGVAQTLALKMGRDVSETVERVTQGIAKQEREILDELVILPKLNDVLAEFAAQNNKTVDELTAAERQTAFTDSAFLALSDAAKGVKIDMDGAAGSIAKTTVAMKNARTALLGGTEQAVSLRDGVLQLEPSMLRLAAAVGENRINAIEVTEALNIAGVSTEDLRKGNVELERSIQGILKTEAKRLGNLAEDNKLTEEQAEFASTLVDIGVIQSKNDAEFIRREKVRLGLTDEQIAQRAELSEVEADLQAGRREALIETQDDIALLKAKGGEQRLIDDLVAEELDIKADILEADGDLEKATKARRKAQLAVITAENRKSKPRGGGKRKDVEFNLDAVFGNTEKALKRFEAQEARALKRITRTGEGASKRFKALADDLEKGRRAVEELDDLIRETLSKPTPFDEDAFKATRDRAFEIEQAQAENVIDLNERRAAIELNQRLREVEAMRAAGVDPVFLAETETAAKVAGIQAVGAARDASLARDLEVAEEQGRLFDAEQIRLERKIADAETLDKVEEETHRATLQRLAERDKAQVFSASKTSSIIQSGVGLRLSAAESVARAVILEGKSLKKSVASTAKSKALEHGILAASEGIKALISFASFDFVRGAAHLTAAAQSAAFAASMGALAAATGEGGGATKSVSGLGAGAFGGGAGAGGGGSAQSARGGGAEFDIGGDVPLSTGALGGSALDSSGEASMQTSGSTTTVNITQNVSSLGTPNEETLQALAKANRKTGQRLGRIAAGGN